MPKLSSPVPVGNVDAATAIAQHRSGTSIIDVREVEEWRAGHIPGALHLPLNHLTPAAVPSEGPVLVICRSGNRSAKAARSLAAAGVQAVNVVGGMAAWAAIGGPLQDDTGQDPTVV